VKPSEATSVGVFTRHDTSALGTTAIRVLIAAARSIFD
jgi:hypothetical protein